jgi:hypothetical protein
MFRKLSKKHLAAVAFVGVLAITGISVAYFTGGSGTVTGSGTVGTSAALSVTTSTPTWSGTLTALYPEPVGTTTDTELIPFTVTNNGNGHQAVTNVQISLPTEANGDAETAASADITGCKAAWFTATADATNGAVPADLASGGTYSGKVDLTMQNLTNTVQDACKGVAPAVTITAS